MSELNSTTKLLMSAAHLYPDDFKDDLKERIEHPYKSPAPEFGIDLGEIRKELEDAKGSHFGKSVFLFIVFVITFLVLIQDFEKNWGILFLALFLASIAEFFYLRSAKEKVRKILGGNGSQINPEENLVGYSSPENKNVVISGGYSPFIGAGFDMDSWSFTVDLSEPDDKQKPVGTITANELHDFIKQRLYTLKIDGMTISDELFVNGRDVRLLSHLLPQGVMRKPVDHVDQQYLLSKINSNDKRERHYRVVRIPMWDGQIQLSMYYRFLVVKENLFCEARFFMLPPLQNKYLEINNIPSKSTRREFTESVLQSIGTSFFSWIPVLLRVFAYIQGGFLAESTRLKRWKRELESNRFYNYGWENSLREKWSSLSYERYFQKVDKDVSEKLVTNEFLAGLLDYLSEKNISIEQFKQTSTKIINEGVMISGGEVKAESLAVGKGAKIAKTAMNAMKGGGTQS